ncbi:MAG: methyltransferase domain-containing protein [Rhodospirillales bacterium]|nr:methyltransferase domain-containing protein [Rhodospirillales bacterium]
MNTENPVCGICGAQKAFRLNIETFFFPDQSHTPDFHTFDNYLCRGCGIVFAHPQPDEAALARYYDSAYRQSPHADTIGGQKIDIPIYPEKMGPSFARFRNLHDAIRALAASHADCLPGSEDTIVDLGAYQGLMAYAATKVWGCQGIAIDYNRDGIAFARDFLGLKLSRSTDDLFAETFTHKPRFVTMFHSLEHLREPERFLVHLRQNILAEYGYLYVEVPNLYGTPLADPTHFYTYSKQSLTYVLEKSGYRILHLSLSGHPQVANFLGRNEEQNIICIARPDPALAAPIAPEIDAEQVQRDIRRHYLVHGGRGVARQLRLVISEAVRLVYYFVFAVVLDRVAPGMSRRLLKIIRGRSLS